MRPAPKVSVLIPTYNYAHFLDETIQSVLAQTFTDFELIIVDNCSTDNTDDVVKKYVTDSRVSFYRNETNLGLVGNWNKCLEYASGEYIKMLCADDKFHPELLQKFVAVMDAHPDVSIISSYVEVFGFKNKPRIPPLRGKVSGVAAREILFKERNWFFAPTAVMFRHADAKKVGSFNLHLLRLTDVEYYLRLLNLGNGYMIPEVLSYLRLHGDTQTAQLNKKKAADVLERYRYANIVKQTGAPKTDLVLASIDENIKRKAIRCAALIYELLPKIYKKENQELFKTAFEIGRAHGVLLAPLSYYLKGKYIRKLLGKK